MAVLGFGLVLQQVVDHGLSSGSATALNQALLLFLGVVTVMAASVAARVYLVSWIGERVVADIRKAVFAHSQSRSATTASTHCVGTSGSDYLRCRCMAEHPVWPCRCQRRRE
ncbi:MAG: ABC transporter transmembrane domain-containing protein [Gammaproteobacteria bacterium]